MKNMLSILVFGFASAAMALTSVTVPLSAPYALVANPQGESLDQLKGDSLNIQISPIRVNQAGYREMDAKKLIYFVGEATSFDVIRQADKALVGTGTFTSKGLATQSSLSIRASNNAITVPGGDVRYTMAGTGPSGDLKQGLLPAGLPVNEALQVRVGSSLSADFVISDQTYSMVRNAVVRFFGLQRSQHTLDAIPGGWYDCGDYLKESITQSYALAMVGMLAAVYPEKDKDQYNTGLSSAQARDGIPDILSEAKYGADYVIGSYDIASGVVADMKLSVGDFGKDHSSWVPPLVQQGLDVSRGGAPRALSNDLWSTTAGRFAAGLAFVAKKYADRNPTYSAKALLVSKALYAYGKVQMNSGSSPAYNGESAYYDDMALAAVALLWATGENTYLQDLAFDATIGNKAMASFPKAGFPGGWLAHTNPSFTHEMANTNWARTESLTLLAFYKLILQTNEMATLYGITTQRDRLVQNVAYNLSISLGYNSVGTEAIALPVSDMGWMPTGVKFGSSWFDMRTQSDWVWNRFQVGNIFDALAYAEVTRSLPAGSVDWKSSEVEELGVRQMDYLLGQNPWDISMVYGVGDKNFNHPHHRQANPEGLSQAGVTYSYRVPVGALQGGMLPGVLNAYAENYDDYYKSEICLDGSATLLGALQILADTSTIKTESPGVVKSGMTKFGYSLSAVISRSTLVASVQSPSVAPATFRLMGVDGRVIAKWSATLERGSNQVIRSIGALPKGLWILDVRTKDWKSVAQIMR